MDKLSVLFVRRQISCHGILAWSNIGTFWFWHFFVENTHPLCKIWHVKKKYVRNAFRVNTENPIIVYVDFSPNGRFVATGPQNFGGVHIWSMRDGSLTVLQDDAAFRALVLAVKFSPDGK